MSRGALSSLFVLALGAFSTSSAHAADVTWGGTYRVEAVKVQGAEMSSPQTDKSYLLHHMVLSPKIVAADGLVVYGRLDILNDPKFGIDANGVVNSVAGDVIGAGPNQSPASATNPQNGTVSNSWGQTQRASPLQVTALYGTWSHEFGQLVVGRTPMQFGLGTTYSAGNGLFDHYISTKDMVGYKIVFGNLSVLPMAAKTNEGALNQEDDVDDYMVQVMYENPETELSLGGLYQIHIVTGNDAPLAPGIGIGGAGATRTGSFKNSLIALYASEKIGSAFRLSVEADLASGDTGIQTSSGAGVGLNSFGIAGELAYQPNDSRWNGGVKFGLVSGDDPGTDNVYEGYQFNRNYNVGMLLFNHPLGQRDFLGTAMIRNGNGAASAQIDTEAVSNAMYLAPSVTFKQRENLSYGGSLVYAMLNKAKIAGGTTGIDTAADLGFELDLNVTYKPFERFTWITEAGLLLPGGAWKGGNTSLENKMPYGFSTKAAISF